MTGAIEKAIDASTEIGGKTKTTNSGRIGGKNSPKSSTKRSKSPFGGVRDRLNTVKQTFKDKKAAKTLEREAQKAQKAEKQAAAGKIGQLEKKAGKVDEKEQNEQKQAQEIEIERLKQQVSLFIPLNNIYIYIYILYAYL